MAQLVKEEFTCNVGDPGSIPGLGRSPREGKGYPLQYSGLENAMDYVVHGVTESGPTEQRSGDDITSSVLSLASCVPSLLAISFLHVSHLSILSGRVHDDWTMSGRDGGLDTTHGTQQRPYAYLLSELWVPSSQDSKRVSRVGLTELLQQGQTCSLGLPGLLRRRDQEHM